MSAPTLTYAQLVELKPCEDSFALAKKKIGGPRKWNGRKVTAAQARDLGVPFDDLIWVASTLARTDKDVERRLRLWMADCAARVLHIYEKSETSDAPRKAIVTARQYARGEIDSDARDTRAAAGAAGAAARAAAGAAAGAAEKDWQFDRLIAWLSDDEPTDWPLPALKQEVAA